MIDIIWNNITQKNILEIIPVLTVGSIQFKSFVHISSASYRMSEEQVRKLSNRKIFGRTNSDNARENLENLESSDPSIANEINTDADVSSQITEIKETYERNITALQTVIGKLKT